MAGTYTIKRTPSGSFSVDICMLGAEIQTQKLDVLPVALKYAIFRIEFGDSTAGAKVGNDEWEIPEEVFFECAHLLARQKLGE